MTRLIVFDVDGTLVDSQRIIVAAMNEAFASHGLPAPSRARALSVVGLSLPQAFTALVGAHGPVEGMAEAYKSAFSRLRADATFQEPFFEGMAEMVEQLAEEPDALLGIATGKSRRGVDHLLDRRGWRGLFATVQTADDAPSKPDPGMLLRAMAETGVGPTLTVMVGDTTFDALMARAAGVGAIGVAWGYHPVAALREAGADPIVADAGELSRLLGAPGRLDIPRRATT